MDRPNDENPQDVSFVCFAIIIFALTKQISGRRSQLSSHVVADRRNWFYWWRVDHVLFNKIAF